MSQATSTARSAGHKWPRWLGWLGWSLLGTLALVALVAFLTLQFGAVHGVELNPYSFARRSYSLYEIPLIRIQVRGVRREDIANRTESFLGSNSYLATAKSAPDVWHIVLAARGNRLPQVGDADILVRYLDAKDHADRQAWVAWSENNPGLAKVFWPAVARLAQEELYVFLPPIFELAQSATDPVVLQKELNVRLAEHLFQLARRLQEREELAEARKLLEEAAKLDAGNPLIKRAREMAAATAAPAK
ncbi:MAG: hypothetical protein SFU86_21220 [Pirellulaceae bacterium]|nr:hypothetical protein [Pirellulaceae bacterium]